MSELLTRVHAQIRERLEQSRAAVGESERLEAALAALRGLSGANAAPPTGRPKDGAGRAPARGSRGRRTTTRPSTSARRPRAARGPNRAAVLEAVRERPGASPAELAAASGVSRPVAYALLKTLLERGELVKQELPGGSSGYAVAPEPPEAGWVGGRPAGSDADEAEVVTGTSSRAGSRAPSRDRR
jgi:IclR helix-turn-helix domain